MEVQWHTPHKVRGGGGWSTAERLAGVCLCAVSLLQVELRHAKLQHASMRVVMVGTGPWDKSMYQGGGGRNDCFHFSALLLLVYIS